MWIPTYHAFPSRVAFLAACDASGWPRGPDGKPMPPEGAVLQEIGPIIAPPSLDADGTPVPGDALDPRYHVNAAWHGTEPSEIFRAVAVVPATPSRSFALPSPPPPVEPPVPSVIPAWKGKASLPEVGLLGTVEAAVANSSGRVADAWVGAAKWQRDSAFLSDLAGALGLSAGQVDQILRTAESVRS